MNSYRNLPLPVVVDRVRVCVCVGGIYNLVVYSGLVVSYPSSPTLLLSLHSRKWRML